MFDLFGLREYYVAGLNPKTGFTDTIYLMAISPEDAAHLARIRGLVPIAWCTDEAEGYYKR